jgi:triphosphatase
MPLETEIKLSIPASAARRLPTHPVLADTPSHRQKLINTYYDTPDRRLEAKRIAVRYRKKGTEWLLTVKKPSAITRGPGTAQRVGGPQPAGRLRFFAR